MTLESFATHTGQRGFAARIEGNGRPDRPSRKDANGCFD